MRIPSYTRQFERDLKKVKRRGKDIHKFRRIARTLAAGSSALEQLPRPPRMPYRGGLAAHL